MVKMPHWPFPLWHKNINYELSKIYSLLSFLDNPHLKLPPVIHIAGTNGKGSTIAFLRSILEEQGLKVHCYTSPHLVRFNERIVISGREISDQLVYEYLERVRIAAVKNNIEVTFFEGITAATFLAFAEIKADIALIEVGMGGRLDATNVVNPILTIITSVSLDHTEYLGDKIYQIALEKAGIMKKNTNCVISLQTEEAYKIFEFKANELEIELISYEYDYVILKNSDGFIFKSNTRNLNLPKPGLVGDHQYINAATAIAGIINLKSFNISDHSIISGVEKVTWPGRLQKITKGRLYNLLLENQEIWLDGAHNKGGAEILSLWIDDQKNCDIYLVVGMTGGRNIKSFLKYFIGKVKLVIGIFVESEALSYQALDITNAAKELGFESIKASSVEDAIMKINIDSPPYSQTKNSKEDNLTIQIHKNNKSKILFCGSLYLVGDFLSKNFK